MEEMWCLDACLFWPVLALTRDLAFACEGRRDTRMTRKKRVTCSMGVVRIHANFVVLKLFMQSCVQISCSLATTSPYVSTTPCPRDLTQNSSNIAVFSASTEYRHPRTLRYLPKSDAPSVAALFDIEMAMPYRRSLQLPVHYRTAVCS